MWRQAVLFFVLGLLTVMRLLTGSVTLNVPLLWWWLGGVIGFLFVFADRFVYAFMGKLMMRSVLFLVVWAVLTILTLTSIANTFSRGFMLGLGTHLVFDLGWDYFTDKRNVDDWFWQVKNVSLREKNIFVWLVFGFYLVIVWFL